MQRRNVLAAPHREEGLPMVLANKLVLVGVVVAMSIPSPVHSEALPTCSDIHGVAATQLRSTKRLKDSSLVPSSVQASF